MIIGWCLYLYFNRLRLECIRVGRGKLDWRFYNIIEATTYQQTQACIWIVYTWQVYSKQWLYRKCSLLLDIIERILKGVAIGIDMFDNSYAYEMTEKGRAITFKFGEASLPTTKTIDLWEESMSQSFIPLDPSCTCYSCSTPHSRAYIHHLLDAHEMLGPLLLMM